MSINKNKTNIAITKYGGGKGAWEIELGIFTDFSKLVHITFTSVGVDSERVSSSVFLVSFCKEKLFYLVDHN